MPVQRWLRPFTLSLLLLALLVAPWPAASADLTVTPATGQQYTINTTGSTTLDAPQNLSLTVGSTSVRLFWDSPANGEQPTGYRVYRVPGPGSSEATQAFNVSARHSSFTDRSADPGSVYVYFVTALTSAGESIPSAPAATIDQYYPHCGVVSIYDSPPYYNVQISCLFPVP